MTKTTRTLVRLGEAKRQTKAQQDIGVLEGNPINKFRMTGWSL